MAKDIWPALKAQVSIWASRQRTPCLLQYSWPSQLGISMPFSPGVRDSEPEASRFLSVRNVQTKNTRDYAEACNMNCGC